MPETREEVVEWFRQRGYFAQPRDYLGSGGVYVARGPVRHGGIDVLDPALFLIPEDGGWSVVLTQHGGDIERFGPWERDHAFREAVRRLA